MKTVRETNYTATIKDGSVYGLSEDLYENLKRQMPEEPIDNSIDDVPENSEVEEDNNENNVDLFSVNPETNAVEQVTEGGK